MIVERLIEDFSDITQDVEHLDSIVNTGDKALFLKDINI